jgi:hypothetical protein
VCWPASTQLRPMNRGGCWPTRHPLDIGQAGASCLPNRRQPRTITALARRPVANARAAHARAAQARAAQALAAKARAARVRAALPLILPARLRAALTPLDPAAPRPRR